MSNPNDLSERQLNQMYDDLTKEQMRLMADLKNGDDMGKAKDIQKQLSFLNTITMNILRFRNLRKQIIEKNNM
jgi:ribosomal protein L29